MKLPTAIAEPIIQATAAVNRAIHGPATAALVEELQRDQVSGKASVSDTLKKLPETLDAIGQDWKAKFKIGGDKGPGR